MIVQDLNGKEEENAILSTVHYILIGWVRTPKERVKAC
jgi:hypothetical protein